MDGGSRGEIEIESFSADAMTVTFHGFNTHPGYAKGRMVRQCFGTVLGEEWAHHGFCVRDLGRLTAAPPDHE